MNGRPSKMIDKLKESCRICLEVHQEEMKQLFCESLQRQIHTCTGIAMEPDDRLSSLICVSCINQLAESYSFIMKCHRTQEYLKNIFDNKNIDDEENSTVENNLEFDDNLKIIERVSEESQDDSIDEKLESYNTTLRKPSFKKRKTKKSLLNLKLKQKNKRHLQCDFCGLITRSHSTLIVHLRIHTGEKPYVCDSCDKRFTQKSSLETHILKLHDEKNFKTDKDNTCENCGKRFANRNNLKIHRRIHTGETPYGCSFCAKRFAQLSSLISHERRHTGEKPYVCKVCDKAFTEQTHLKRHQSVHSEEKPFICNICGKGVKSTYALKQHSKIHTHEKEHICEQCGMSFMIRGNLDAHIRVVHSEKSGQCNICKKMFSNLNDHMVKHTGEKPFKCDTCDKSFSHNRGLIVHNRQHVAAGKYKCQIEGCARSFSAQWVLECHMMKHTGRTPHVCKYCTKGFMRICHLTKHVKMNHPNEEQNQNALQDQNALF